MRFKQPKNIYNPFNCIIISQVPSKSIIYEVTPRNYTQRKVFVSTNKGLDKLFHPQWFPINNNKPEILEYKFMLHAPTMISVQ